MRKESKIGEGSEQFSSLVLDHEPSEKKDRGSDRDNWCSEKEDTLPTYVTNTDHWGEVHQKVLNRH